jgi:hypothetical protein
VAGVAGPELDLELVLEHQGAEVVCWAENSVGRGEGRAELYLHAAPTILSPPQAVRAKPGQEAVLACRAAGRPAPSIAWRRLGAAGRVVAIGPLLTLVASTATAGSYYCTASAPGEPAVSSPPAALVLARPPALTSPATQHAALPGPLGLECRASAGGRPAATWAGPMGHILPGETSHRKERNRISSLAEMTIKPKTDIITK